MYPNIVFLGRTIPAYGLVLIIGCCLAILYFKTGKRREYCHWGDAESAFIWGGVGAFLGAKALSLFTQLPDFFSEFHYLFSAPAKFLEKYFLSGFVFYGGLYGSIAAAWLFARRKKIAAAPLLKCLLPAFVLIHAFGRIGCFLVGCCYGIPTHIPWLGVEFTLSEIAPTGIPLIPVQLMEALAEFILFFLLAFWAAKGKNGRWLLAQYLLCYGVLRFALEFLRGDFYRGIIGPLSLSQWISLFTVACGILLFCRDKRKSAPST